MPDRLVNQSGIEPQAADRLLVFSAGQQHYALPFSAIEEVIQAPPLVRVPLSPPALLGVSNLRGSVLPIADLATMMSVDDAGAPEGGKVLVLSGSPQIGLRVSTVHGVVGGDDGSRPFNGGESGLAEAASASSHSQEEPSVPILDLADLLARNFELGASVQASNYAHSRHVAASYAGETSDENALVTFEVAGQEFALPVECIVEVIPATRATDGASRRVKSLVAFRGAVLPLLSMRSLLGFAESQAGKRMLVAKIAGAHVALTVDSVNAMIRAPADKYEAVPSVISQCETGAARIQSVIKRDEGRKLVSVLSPEHLLREDVMNRIRREAAASQESGLADTVAQSVVLVFELGGQEYGVDISAIEEVSNIPEQITRLPHGPDFLRGVTNLRGAVLPVIDQRLRFNLPVQDGDRGRLVVMRVASQLAGFIVDGVSEVLRTAETAVLEAPTVVAGGNPVEGLINLAEQDRMILLLDPALLLSTTERDLLETLGTTREAQSAVDQTSDRR